MPNRLISTIYLRGDESFAHHKGKSRSRDWSFVPKNSKCKGKGKQVNVFQHMYEMQHGIGDVFVYTDYTPMSDEDMLKVCNGYGTAASDPLLEMLK